MRRVVPGLNPRLLPHAPLARPAGQDLGRGVRDGHAAHAGGAAAVQGHTAVEGRRPAGRRRACRWCCRPAAARSAAGGLQAAAFTAQRPPPSLCCALRCTPAKSRAAPCCWCGQTGPALESSAAAASTEVRRPRLACSGVGGRPLCWCYPRFPRCAMCRWRPPASVQHSPSLPPSRRLLHQGPSASLLLPPHGFKPRPPPLPPSLTEFSPRRTPDALQALTTRRRPTSTSAARAWSLCASRGASQTCCTCTSGRPPPSPCWCVPLVLLLPLAAAAAAAHARPASCHFHHLTPPALSTSTARSSGTRPRASRKTCPRPKWS